MSRVKTAQAQVIRGEYLTITDITSLKNAQSVRVSPEVSETYGPERIQRIIFDPGSYELPGCASGCNGNNSRKRKYRPVLTLSPRIMIVQSHVVHMWYTLEPYRFYRNHRYS